MTTVVAIVVVRVAVGVKVVIVVVVVALAVEVCHDDNGSRCGDYIGDNSGESGSGGGHWWC